MVDNQVLSLTMPEVQFVHHEAAFGITMSMTSKLLFNLNSTAPFGCQLERSENFDKG